MNNSLSNAHGPRRESTAPSRQGSGVVQRLMTGLLAVVLLCSLPGCGSEPPSPEQQLRALIGEAETAVESRDLAAAMALVDPQYRDDRQRDWRQLRALLAGYFFRHPSIYVISQVDRIEVPQPDQARAVVFAGLAGSAQEAESPLAGWRANLLRLELQFSRPDGEDWRLASASWRPATREDFTR